MFDPVTYRSMQESIRPSPELVSRAVRSARPRRTVMLRRVLAAAAALALCICVPALAGSSVIYQLVYTCLLYTSNIGQGINFGFTVHVGGVASVENQKNNDQ